MILKDFLPNPALREFIQCYRICHFEFDKTIEIPLKAYPPKPEECIYFILKGSIDIEFMNCGKKNLDLPIVLFGQQTSINKRYFFVGVFLNFQIVFQPTSLFRLTGIPSFKLTNQCFDSENIFSKNIRFIHEQLQHAKSYSEMLLIADRFVATLVSNARKDVHLLDSVSKLMMQRDGYIPLDWLAKEPVFAQNSLKGNLMKEWALILKLTQESYGLLKPIIQKTPIQIGIG